MSVLDMLTSDLTAMGERGFEYLSENYTARHEYDIIMARVGEKETVTLPSDINGSSYAISDPSSLYVLFPCLSTMIFA